MLYPFPWSDGWTWEEILRNILIWSPKICGSHFIWDSYYGWTLKTWFFSTFLSVTIKCFPFLPIFAVLTRITLPLSWEIIFTVTEWWLPLAAVCSHWPCEMSRMLWALRHKVWFNFKVTRLMLVFIPVLEGSHLWNKCSFFSCIPIFHPSVNCIYWVCYIEKN